MTSAEKFSLLTNELLRHWVDAFDNFAENDEIVFVSDSREALFTVTHVEDLFFYESDAKVCSIRLEKWATTGIEDRAVGHCI